ncbi:hypothetical protein QTO34_003945, partial [Cnephaeus nilssonii]
MEESKLLDDTVFRTTFIRLLKNLLKTFEKLEETSKELSETFKDLNENAKKNGKGPPLLRYLKSVPLSLCLGLRGSGRNQQSNAACRFCLPLRLPLLLIQAPLRLPPQPPQLLNRLICYHFQAAFPVYGEAPGEPAAPGGDPSPVGAARTKTMLNSLKAEKDEKTAEAKLESSRGWFIRFKERNHLHNIKVQGEAASVDVEAILSYQEDLTETIKAEGPPPVHEFMHWASSIGIKCHPGFLQLRKEYSLPGLKASKDRLTLLLGTNALDEVKISTLTGDWKKFILILIDDLGEVVQDFNGRQIFQPPQPLGNTTLINQQPSTSKQDHPPAKRLQPDESLDMMPGATFLPSHAAQRPRAAGAVQNACVVAMAMMQALPPAARHLPVVSKLQLASHMWLFGPLSVALPQNTTDYKAANIIINLYIVNEPWVFSLAWCSRINSVTTDNIVLLRQINYPYYSMILEVGDPKGEK